MKKLSEEKKLSLKRATVSNLERFEMKPVKGGWAKTEWCTRDIFVASCYNHCLVPQDK